ncbi:MAG: preprotein translocase subunit SecA [Patescibacteria group bacterium]|nr:preprotein translocase subunit SecA [Patescibacteria group bacterium]
MSILDRVFRKPNEKYLEKIKSIVEKINSLEKEFEGFSNEQLKEKTTEFKKRLEKEETLDNILPEAFAAIRETSKRTLNQRPYDSQIIGGIVLHQRKIAEMKTGEGKTLAATLPLYLNALTGKGAHLITVNDYLARRDAVWMGQIYHALGLSIGCINHQQSFIYDPEFKKSEEEKDQKRDELGGFYVVEDFLRPCERRQAYSADITYGTNNEFGFDYLRDNMIYDLSQRVQRDFNFAIIDEIDSILIDEARTPLIISAPDMESSRWYKDFAGIIPKLDSEIDYEVDEKSKTVSLTEKGINKVEKILKIENIYESKGIRYLRYLEQALRAQARKVSDKKPLFIKDVHYVVKNGEIIIVDEFTGRLMPGRRWSKGLHQAIEAKEGLYIRPESVTLASITFQNLFRMYKKLAGMTGTALTSAEEFEKVYGLDVIVVPTNKKLIRIALADKIYKTEQVKYQEIVNEIKKRNELGQPVLVGTRSIEKNEYLSKLLQRQGIKHQVLNAKNHQKEGEIIAQAGKLDAVTIATNMAGRGVDIVLGGNPVTKEQAEKVKQLGGLHVIGTERHEARRIDNQLRGRSGRQGDSGSSQFFLSLEDDLMRIFGGERLKKLITKLNLPDDQPIEANLISKAIEDAQSRIEGMNFDARKHVLEYDDVINKHRDVVYKKRREFLEKAQNKELKPFILEMFKNSKLKQEDYEKKEKEFGENADNVFKSLYFRVLDMLWVGHLDNMEYLKDSVSLRAYGQKNPLVEYKKEGHKMFKKLLDTLEKTVTFSILNAKLGPAPDAPAQRYVPQAKKKIGRNEPCPCGSKKKYKKCCMNK